MSDSAALGSDVELSEPGTSHVRRYNVERSCIRCHERKVRCNKNIPCSACVRAKAQCFYPGPGRAKRRSQRTAQSQVVPRLERLEKALAVIPERRKFDTTIEKLNFGIPSGLSPPQSPAYSITCNAAKKQRSAPPDQCSSQGLLVKDGTSTRYINESLLSQVLEKESELQTAIGTPESTSPSSFEKRLPAQGFCGLFSDPWLTATDPSSLWPSRWQAIRLWQIYLNNVNPLIRILHIPTIQPAFYAAIKNTTQVPADMCALLFAIFFAAVTSIDNAETKLVLGDDRKKALVIYQQGLEWSLHMAQFLDTPTISSLQAMSIHLLCRRHHSSGRSGWALNGLLIRAAQSIGLHRDGEHFKLSPLDCEIRRRLWWLIVGLDARAAEDHGIITGTLISSCDTKIPLSINDNDLTSGMERAPEPKEGYGEMSMFLVAIEANRVIQEMNTVIIREQNNEKKTQQLEQLSQNLKTRLQDKYIQHLDINIPIQWYAHMLAHIQIGKCEIMVRQQYLKTSTSESVTDTIFAECLAYAIDVMERSNIMRTDQLSKNFQWLSMTYTPYFAIIYILWHLCVRPHDPAVERAWDAVDKVFQVEEDPNLAHPGRKWNVLLKLREKALYIRQSTATRRDSRTALLDSGFQDGQAENLEEDMFNIAAGEGMVWDLDFNLVSGFQGFPSDLDLQSRAFIL